MNWFDIPEGYSCVTRQNDTTLYAYQGSRRDIYTLNGLKWEKTATSTNSSISQNAICVITPQIPSTILTGVYVAAALFVICGFSVIYKMIKRTYL